MSVVRLIRMLKFLNIVEDKEVNLSHAGKANKYLDIKKALGNYGSRDCICDLIGEKISSETDVIACSGHGGMPIGSIVSNQGMMHLTMVRLDAKDHGIIKNIDGYYPNEENIVEIVDDVFTTGGTLLKIYDILKQTGAEIVGARTVVKRNDMDVVEKELPFPVTYLINATDLY